MYPHVNQLATRRELARELQPIRKADRTGRNTTVAGPAIGPPRYKVALLTWTGAYALITLIPPFSDPRWPLGRSAFAPSS